MRWHSILDRLHALAARSPLAVKFCLKLRNQAQRVIGRSLTDGADLETNGELAVIRLLRPRCLRVMDVGANRGDWTAAFLAGDARPDLRIAVYEPGRTAGEVLAHRFAGEQRVIVRRVAVGAHEGTARFFESRADSTVSTLVGPVEDDPTGYDVPVVTVDGECRRLGWAGVDWLKVDAEGGDAAVLAGAGPLLADGAIKFAQFEYNGTWAEAGATLQHTVGCLERWGYRVFLIRAAGLFAFDPRHYGEFFSYANFLAVHRGEPGFDRELHFAAQTTSEGKSP